MARSEEVPADSSREMDWKAGVAQSLVETLKMVDAVPLSNDLMWEYAFPPYALKASALHSALEWGMKALNPSFDPDDKKYHTHDLAKVYTQMPSDVQGKLHTAFGDAVSFYGFPAARKQWFYLTDLGTYLRETGSEKQFALYRYWALEKKEECFIGQQAILFLNRELVRFISDVLTGFGKAEGGPFTVSAEVENAIGETLLRWRYQPLPQRYYADLEGWKADDDALTLWLQGYSSCLLALKDAYGHNFDVVNAQGNNVLRNTYKDLAATTDYRVKPALTHALQTFRAKSSYCQVSPPATVEVYQSGRSGSIKTPAGSQLGLIEERYDGLWYVRSFDNMNRGDIAKSQSDAVGLLVDAGTQLVSVSVRSEPAQEKRVRFHTSIFRSGNSKCEFWDLDHGILPGDVITLVIPVENHNGIARQVDGTVKSVDAHVVTIASGPVMIVRSP